MTTTILGANGRLGGVLRRYSARANLPWHTQTRSQTGSIQWCGMIGTPGTDNIFRPRATLINMIGSTAPDADALQNDNVRFVQDLLRHADDTGVAHVILASSAAVYGHGDDTPLPEDAPLQPLTPYGRSKAQMEEIAHQAPVGNGHPAITILRIANVAGSDALLCAAETHTAKNRPMSLHRFPNGDAPRRSYIGPRDLFDVVRALSEPHVGEPRTFNVAAPSPVSLDAALRGYKSHLLTDLEWQDAPAPEGIPPKVVLSTTKLASLIKLDENPDYAYEMARQVAQDRTA